MKICYFFKRIENGNKLGHMVVSIIPQKDVRDITWQNKDLDAYFVKKTLVPWGFPLSEVYFTTKNRVLSELTIPKYVVFGYPLVYPQNDY